MERTVITTVITLPRLLLAQGDKENLLMEGTEMPTPPPASRIKNQ